MGHLRIVQLYDEFDRAHRQYAFARERLWMSGPVPEEFHEIGQRFSGNAVAEFDTHICVNRTWRMFRAGKEYRRKLFFPVIRPASPPVLDSRPNANKKTAPFSA